MEVVFFLDVFSDSRMTLDQEHRGARRNLVDQSMKLFIASSTEGDVARGDRVDRTPV